MVDIISTEEYDIFANQLVEDKYCPTCGAKRNNDFQPMWLLSLVRGFRQKAVLAELLKARSENRGLSLKEITYSVYAHDESKIEMLDDPVLSAAVYIYALKRKLEDYGWTVVGPRITGLGYWLTEHSV